MTVLHVQEIRDMTPAEREAELDDLKTELLNAQAVQAAGGAPENPGRITELQKAIARIKTIQGEEGDLRRRIMPLTPETLPRHELVGLDARSSRRPSRTSSVSAEQSSGDDTDADTRGGRPGVARAADSATFAFDLSTETVLGDGDRLVARPARRTENTGDSLWR